MYHPWLLCRHRYHRYQGRQARKQASRSQVFIGFLQETHPKKHNFIHGTVCGCGCHIQAVPPLPLPCHPKTLPPLPSSTTPLSPTPLFFYLFPHHSHPHTTAEFHIRDFCPKSDRLRTSIDFLPIGRLISRWRLCVSKKRKKKKTGGGSTGIGT